MGLFEIVGSPATAQFLLLVVRVFSIVFGLVLLAHPTARALALVVVIGIFAIVRRIVLQIQAFRTPEMPA